MQRMTVAACLVVGVMAVLWLTSMRNSPFPVVAPGGGEPPRVITVQQVRALAELAVLRVPCVQLVEAEVAGYLGSTSCLVLASGEAVIGTDLRQAQVDVNEGRHTVAVTLPSPRVISAALNQSETTVMFVNRTGLWCLLPGPANEDRAIESAMEQAERMIRETADTPAYMEQARRQAQAVIEELTSPRGWSLILKWVPP